MGYTVSSHRGHNHEEQDMPRVTHVKKAQQRYATTGVLDEAPY